jgi:hypothetical protein
MGEFLMKISKLIKFWFFKKYIIKEYHRFGEPTTFTVTRDKLFKIMIEELEKFHQDTRRSLCIYTSDGKHCVADWSINWWNKIS